MQPRNVKTSDNNARRAAMTVAQQPGRPPPMACASNAIEAENGDDAREFAIQDAVTHDWEDTRARFEVLDIEAVVEAEHGRDE